jgi:Co/Zn/Cd efflux system component/copper chaperone CopZ
MNRTAYHVEKMDCSAEEQLVRMRLESEPGIRSLAFDFAARRLVVTHEGDQAGITGALAGLGLGAREVEHGPAGDSPPVTGKPSGDSDRERGPLRIALAINAAFFAFEFAAGLWSGSMGLLADSLDNLADALVYALSLLAVGGTMLRKKRLARGSGYLQLGLAVFGLFEVVRRCFFAGGTPDVTTMIVVSALTMAGNVATLLVLRRARTGEAHVEASWIFTSNDIKVNGLVILSALVVWATGSPLPDLVAGALVFVIVAGGARRILALAR